MTTIEKQTKLLILLW